MGKRIIVQRRGAGSHTYRVNKKNFKFELKIPTDISGEGTVTKLISSPAHSAPLAKISYKNGEFFIPAFKGMIEGQKILLEGEDIKDGNIVKLKDAPVKTKIYCIESRPLDGGKYIKTAGSNATISRVVGDSIMIVMPSKKEKAFRGNCRAVIGVAAGSGRLDKPIVKAGKNFHIKKAKGKLWPRTSAVKMNAIDHPFGSGRGKNPKSKIAKRNSAPGKKVGLLRPARTGKRK